MPAPRALPCSLLFLALLFATQTAPADELRDISQMASRGQQAAALDRINSYASANPSNVQAQFIRGVLLAENGKRDEAIRAFTDITEKYPNLPEPYNNLAVLYADRGQYDKAQAALEKAIRTHPSYATAHENLGDLYARMASEAYDKALQLDTGNVRTQNKLAMIKDLVSTGSSKPMIAANNVPASPLEAPPKDTLAAPKAAELKPTEPKPLESKPAEAKPANSTPEKAAPAKPVTPIEKPLPQPAETAKPAEPKVVAKDATKPEPVNNNDGAIEAAVRQWAKAWADKNVSGYLASYADSFKTPDNLARKDWEKTRRDRIMAPAKISVEIGNLQIRMDKELARASFKQSYRAGNVAMRTSKTLVLRNVSGRWLIEQELTDR